MGSSGVVVPLGRIRGGASSGDRRCVGGAGEVRGYRTLDRCGGSGRIHCRTLLLGLGWWKVLHVEKAGKAGFEVGGRFLERLPFLVAENAGFGKQISAVDSSVTASKAAMGKVGDEGAGVDDFRAVLIVGKIPNFGEVIFAWVSCVLSGEEVQCW